mmetsp:Transcript_3904/g.5772  ORF Transcript_3904/g.5772 Transcript_3904/m.5772 type:complete len:188 (+) Transcript_3904:85-648(+)
MSISKKIRLHTMILFNIPNIIWILWTLKHAVHPRVLRIPIIINTWLSLAVQIGSFIYSAWEYAARKDTYLSEHVTFPMSFFSSGILACTTPLHRWATEHTIKRVIWREWFILGSAIMNGLVIATVGAKLIYFIYYICEEFFFAEDSSEKENLKMAIRIVQIIPGTRLFTKPCARLLKINHEDVLLPY